MRYFFLGNFGPVPHQGDTRVPVYVNHWFGSALVSVRIRILGFDDLN
jgi:hypothetical protein